MPHQVLCPIQQGHLLADPCGFHTICSRHDQLAEEPFFLLVCYGHRFLWRTICYNTIFSPGSLKVKDNH